MSRPTVETSVVTLTHNKLAVTRRCLASWLGSATSAPWELIVVDNGSSDGTREWLAGFRDTAARAGVETTVLENPGNIGCSTARNQAIARARGRRVLFADNDVALRCRGWIERLGTRLEADPALAMVGPRLVYPFPPHDIQCAGVAVSRAGRVQFVGRGEPRDDPRFAVEREVQALISACCMVRREVFDRLGGFDEAFNPVQYEDLDLCYRARDAGWRLLYVPSVEAYHFESVTTAGTATLSNTYVIIRNGLRFKQRWRGRFAAENGPPDEATRWREIRVPDFASVGELPVID